MFVLELNIFRCSLLLLVCILEKKWEQGFRLCLLIIMGNIDEVVESVDEQFIISIIEEIISGGWRWYIDESFGQISQIIYCLVCVQVFIINY